METGTRLAIYGAGLVVAFGGAFGIAGAAVPDSAVAAWAEGSEMNNHSAGHGSTHDTAESLKGLSLSAGGYVLSPVAAPGSTGTVGDLTFQVQDASGEAVTDFAVAHDKDLHLIVVRADGAEFRHVHPSLDQATGTWSIPWKWEQAGTYRVYADFTPDGENASGVTLTRTVQVAGDVTPVELEPASVDEVDGLTVSLDGELVAGSMSDLTISVSRDGEPVTALQPYLGAFGHLVALREGDLAYLHIHAEGAEPQPGDTSGPDIAFMGEAPTAGRYLLYLDFQVDGEVHTAEFVLDATHGDGESGAETADEGTATHGESHSDDH